MEIRGYTYSFLTLTIDTEGYRLQIVEFLLLQKYK